jgi:uncharacterized protein
MKFSSTLAALLVFAGCLAAGGCDGLNSLIPPPQADPTRYFVLAATPAPAAAVPGKIRVGLKSVELASYLKTHAMVVRSGSNEIIIEDFQRWAEPLGDGIARVLRARLLADPALGSVSLQPFAFDTERDYDVAVDVIHCEGATDSDGRSFARFAAVIEISTAGSNPRVVQRRVFAAPATAWNGRDFGQLAGLLSGDVDQLGREIVLALTSAPPPPAQAQ